MYEYVEPYKNLTPPQSQENSQSSNRSPPIPSTQQIPHRPAPTLPKSNSMKSNKQGETPSPKGSWRQVSTPPGVNYQQQHSQSVQAEQPSAPSAEGIGQLYPHLPDHAYTSNMQYPVSQGGLQNQTSEDYFPPPPPPELLNDGKSSDGEEYMILLPESKGVKPV